jgi:hypothetical protein
MEAMGDFSDDEEIQRNKLRIEFLFCSRPVPPVPVKFTRQDCLGFLQCVIDYYSQPSVQDLLRRNYTKLNDLDPTGRQWQKTRNALAEKIQRSFAMKLGLPDSDDVVDQIVRAFGRPEFMFDREIQERSNLLRILEDPGSQDRQDSCDLPDQRRPSEMVPEPGRRWKVVGGAQKGGIIVRKLRDQGSEAFEERLGQGAEVEEVELSGHRVHYRRVSGRGPDEGWVTAVTTKGQVLLRSLPNVHRLPNQSEEVPAEAPPAPKTDSRSSSSWTLEASNASLGGA